MSVTSLGDMLPKRAQKAGIAEQVEASMVLEQFTVKAKELWGDEVVAEMKPLYIKNKTLTVAVTNASLAQEMKLHEQEILTFLNKDQSEETVERLRYLI